MSMFIKDASCDHLTDGEHGKWKVEIFVVSKEDAYFNNMRAMFGGERFISPGTYKRIMRYGKVIMSNTGVEVSDHISPVLRGRNEGGHILINGLGMGMCLSMILTGHTRPSGKVEKITVIEIDQELIDFVGVKFTDPDSKFYDKRVEIVCADAFEYEPPRGVRYSVVWHDIWDDICEDNAPEMSRLKRKYEGCSDWQGCWCEDEARGALLRRLVGN